MSISTSAASVSLSTSSAVTFGSPVISVQNVLKIGVGAGGSFTSPTGQLITLQKGVVTNIYNAQKPLPNTAVYNPAYIDNVIQQINALAADINLLNPCVILQTLINDVMKQIQDEINSVEAQIAALTLLITIPHDLASVIRWISNFISPYIAAALALMQQMQQMINAITALLQAIANLAGSITFVPPPLPSIKITLPSLPWPPKIQFPSLTIPNITTHSCHLTMAMPVFSVPLPGVTISG